MNIDEISDIVELESLAYRQVKLIHQAQANLDVLESRIAQLTREQQPPQPPEPPHTEE